VSPGTTVRTATLVVLATVLVACGWDGPGVEVVQPQQTATTSDPPGPVDVPVESLPSESLPAEPTANTEPVSEGDLARVTLPAGGRRPLPDDLPSTIAVVGDSLTLAATEEIRSALSSVGIEVIAIDGAENRRMTHGATPEPGLDSIATLVSGAAPEMWVVALGTNDIGAETDPERYGGDVQRLLDEIPAASSVVWVDVWIRDRKSAVERANQVLRDVLAERPRSMVADWFSHGDDVGVVTTDGVHLTADGRRVFAATIVDAILALSS
jgi:lysophospholipase L1-like esterase